MPTEKIKKLLAELKRLKAIKDGGETAGLLFDLANKLEMIKGDKGETPVKGVDYFTDKEINQIIREITNSIRVPKDGTKGERGEIGKSGKDGKNGQDGRDGVDGRDGEKGLQGINGADGSPDVAETIVAKLESIEEEDEKLKIEAIRNLRKELDELRKEVKTKGQVIYAGGGGKSRSKVYDLSSKLDGTTKIFGLPAFWEVTGVVCSSFPNALRPVIDYSTDSSSITFTSEINAASTLQSGQTVLIFYTEP